MREHFIIGLTGGIGSGKSAVAKMFEQLGVPVMDADFYSKNALEIGTECYRMTVNLFGKDCLNSDGSIDRRYVASKVFSDELMREQLNGIIHPYVRNRMHAETEKLPCGFVVWEVPLLFESGMDSDCSVTVAVACRESIRIKRIIKRDHLTKEQAKARIDAQMTDLERKEKADYTIRNEGGLEQLYDKVVSLLQKLEERHE